MKDSTKNKKILIEIIVIAALIAVLAAVVIVDTFTNTASASLTAEDAQQIIDDTFSDIPNTLAKTAISINEKTEITVNSVEKGVNREFILACTYETVDIYPVYTENKQEIFSRVYSYYNDLKAEGAMVNGTKIRYKTDEIFASLLETAQSVSGEVCIYIYEVDAETSDEDIFAIPFDDTTLRVYLSDELINTVMGGIISVSNDIKATEEILYNGETVSVSTLNTLRNGISDAFSLRNYSSERPDSSPYFVALWNDFCDEFYRNFIQNAQWTYLAKGLLTTLEITLLAAVLGIIIGFVCAIIRCTYDKTGKLMIANQIVSLYLTVIRGTPVMIQLMIIYFVLLLPVGIEKFPAAVLCFAINSGAYVAEIVRGGIMSVDNGQIEAGRSLGLNYIQTMYYIVIPQAFKAVLPSLANEFITLLKESSVAFYIGVADLTQGGLKIRSITYSNFMPLIAVALIYLVLVLILTKLVGILERRLRKDER